MNAIAIDIQDKNNAIDVVMSTQFAANAKANKLKAAQMLANEGLHEESAQVARGAINKERTSNLFAKMLAEKAAKRWMKNVAAQAVYDFTSNV
jgi:hypothetical protein